MKEISYKDLLSKDEMFHKVFYLIYTSQYGYPNVFVRLYEHSHYSQSYGSTDLLRSKFKFRDLDSSRGMDEPLYRDVSFYEFEVGSCHLYEIEHDDEITMLNIK